MSFEFYMSCFAVHGKDIVIKSNPDDLRSRFGEKKDKQSAIESYLFIQLSSLYVDEFWFNLFYRLSVPNS